MKIVTVPHELLHAQAKPVERINKKLKKLVDDMIATLIAQRDPEGVGLAAPQIGISMSLFIMKPTRKTPVTVLINPRIMTDKPKMDEKIRNQKDVKKSKKSDESKLEGCLSIPRIWGSVDRVQSVRVKYQTLTGAWEEKIFTGFEAVIVQHEIDHLSGILFTQRVLEKNGQLYKEIDGELEKYEI